MAEHFDQVIRPRHYTLYLHSGDVTSLFRHLLHDALFTKTRLGGQALAA